MIGSSLDRHWHTSHIKPTFRMVPVLVQASFQTQRGSPSPSVLFSTVHLHYGMESLRNMMPARSLRFLSESHPTCRGEAGGARFRPFGLLSPGGNVLSFPHDCQLRFLRASVFLGSQSQAISVTFFQAFSSVSGAADTWPAAGLVSSSAVLKQST